MIFLEVNVKISIFHSEPNAFSPNSKALGRTDVEIEDEVQGDEAAVELLKQGHTINGILYDYQSPKQKNSDQARQRHSR